MKYFTEAIKEGCLKNLKTDSKYMILGLGMAYPSEGLASNFPDRVIDTPVSELSITGTAVGLAARGFKPLVVHGRIEFAMLAFDQIFTQASRWDYMFGGDYKCPLSLRIAIGRQWGNGPQHTANYHSIFLQSPFMDVFIPSTPQEAYDHIRYMSKLDNPSVMLEHRWLYKTKQKIIYKKRNKINQAKIYNYSRKKDLLIVTYADTLIDSLKAIQKIPMKNKNRLSILNFSYFPSSERLSKKIKKYMSEFKNILFVDSAPYEFGLLSGVAGLYQMDVASKQQNLHKLSPPFIPCPTAPSLTKKYYVNHLDIEKKINFIFGTKDTNKNKKISFDELNLWPEYDYSKISFREI